MQTNLADFIRLTPDGQEADAILRKCVHCGFCNATCPTYQLLGDELDGPRGRIYLIKEMLEGQTGTFKTQLHLDRCLTCRNCETTCPSGVEYGRLIDIGRKLASQKRQVMRPLGQRLLRMAVREGLTRRAIFDPAMKLGLAVRRFLPQRLREKLPQPRSAGVRARRSHPRKVLLLDGCVQPSMAPNINAAATRVLDALGIESIVAPKAGCCGAIRHHLDDQEHALDQMRQNIDAWMPFVEAGAEAIVMTASGCGVMVQEYGHLLRHDVRYAAAATRISALTRDISQILAPLLQPLLAHLGPLGTDPIAFHPPCTLQHGQKIDGLAESLLRAAGAQVHLCADSHLCCGSAGTYSLLEPKLARRLRDQKLAALSATGATVIASANVGCIAHLQSGTKLPVRHWIEIIDEALISAPSRA